MIRPAVGELLRGVAAQLDASVVPELVSGSAARNQTRAAIAVLRRIAGVWDEVVPSLLADLADLEGALCAAADRLERGDPRRAALLEALDAAPALDAGLATYAPAAARHEAIQDAFDAALAALGGDASGAAANARQELLAALRRSVARSRSLSGR